MALKDFVPQTRGGKGTIAYKDVDVVGAAMLSDDDLILLSGVTASICLSATDVPLLGKTGQGNILIKGTKVSSITKI